jgi:hypothetical protein
VIVVVAVAPIGTVLFDRVLVVATFGPGIAGLPVVTHG